MVARELQYNFNGKDNLSRAAKSAGKGLDEFKSELRETEIASAAAGKQLDELGKKRVALAKAFATTGDNKFLQDLRAVNRESSKLGGVQKILQKELANAGTKSGLQFGTALTTAIPRGLAGLGPVGAIVGTAIAVPAAAIVAATLAAGVIGGAGGVGIVGGLMAARDDPRVVQAAEGIGKEFDSIMRDAGQAFAPAAVDSLNIIKRHLPGLRKDLASMFKNPAPLLAPLTEGVSSAVSSITRGLAKLTASDGAKKVFNELGVLATKVGAAIGRFFERFTDDGDEAAGAIRYLTLALVGTIDAVGKFIEYGAGMFRTLVDIGLAVSAVMEAMYGWIPFLGDKIKDGRANLLEIKAAMDQNVDSANNLGNALPPVSVGIQSMADAATNAEAAAKLLDETTTSLIGTMLSVDEAVVAAKQGYADLVEELKDGKRTLDTNTQAGRDNVDQILDQIGKWETLRQANIDGGMAVDEANGKFASQISALEATMIKMGYTKAEVQKLIRKYQEIPAGKLTKVTANTGPATTAINKFVNKLNGINGTTVTTYIKVKTIGTTDHITSNTGGGRVIEPRASGGPITAGRSYLVGEDGPELVTAKRNGYVHDASSTARMAGRGGASSPTVVMNNPVFTNVSNARELLRELNKICRIEFNGNTGAMFGGA